MTLDCALPKQGGCPYHERGASVALKESIPGVTKGLPRGQKETPPPELPEGAFGIPPGTTQIQLEPDVCKELTNKLTWAIGSTYRTRYSGKRNPVRDYAWRIAQAIIKSHGFPTHIAKEL